jgi:hypothetical protein
MAEDDDAGAKVCECAVVSKDNKVLRQVDQEAGVKDPSNLQENRKP